ncbi:LysR family transcriptional regulator [Rhizobium sp. 25PS6]|uniref:HTH-type transcriptional regulator TtuA n=3 Tax=Rhizobium TaxID=379 RepID=A0A432N9T2_9HYPH|nr:MULTISPECIES: LysR family transcriptional regulator [Rhizobium]MBA1345314.1 LysR family transcriptional regulator [Rhizobium sp. WYCCWR 11146]MDR9764346.1 LysR family transcriptional regulator [Rhizobium redzepovicii]MDR9776333.1 LysR family transcriptional regulator [Rhizobium hidalgonense]MDR9785458.1 LysR family transcriptional regulator [Rhizobium redzepovicii]MDR9814656.1 LysR family transcriptional regulator [Rhizobium hidalgonense]
MYMRRAMIPDIINLQAFECAARHENFSRAAEELNLTQGAISRQIAELEQQTGLRLFERIKRRVVLSDAGQKLLPEVRQLLVQSERLMIGAVAAGTMSSSLRIATLPTFGAKWLVPKLGRFIADHSDVAICVESRSSPFSFAEENFDMAIHFGQPTWAGATATFLCNESVLPVASPAFQERTRAATNDPFCSAQLLHLTTRPKLWSDWSAHHGIRIPRAYQGPRFDQFSMIISAAVAGLGVALLPTYLVEDELASGTLAPFVPLSMQTENAYYIVRPEQKRTLGLAVEFQEWLLQEINRSISITALGPNIS